MRVAARQAHPHKKKVDFLSDYIDLLLTVCRKSTFFPMSVAARCHGHVAERKVYLSVRRPAEWYLRQGMKLSKTPAVHHRHSSWLNALRKQTWAANKRESARDFHFRIYRMLTPFSPLLLGRKRCGRRGEEEDL